ncbi:Purine permease 3, partial [Linum grandiflorum]
RLLTLPNLNPPPSPTQPLCLNYTNLLLNLAIMLEMEMIPSADKKQTKTSIFQPTLKTFLLLLNCVILTVGQVAGPLLGRMYFIHGGKKLWLSTWANTAGFPILLIPIFISYKVAKTTRPKDTPLFPSRWLMGASALLGILLGFDCYLYSFGTAYLPVSVVSLVSSSQLAFTAVLAFFIVGQKFTHYSINAVALMTFGSVILGLHMDQDVPKGESHQKYVMGFLITLAAAAGHGLFLTLIEYTRMRPGITITFDIVMQLQFIMSMFATVFSTVPMLINNDFQSMAEEAAEFDLGVTKYYLIIFLGAVALQLMIIGVFGVVFSSSSLFAGIMTALLVPVQQVFAVIFLKEGFNAEKGMALALCLWGFASHVYGGYKTSISSNKGSDGRDGKDENSV